MKNLLKQMFRIELPFLLVLIYIYIVYNAAIQTTGKAIILTDDVANCYTVPYTFLLSYFLSTAYLSYRKQIIQKIVNNVKHNINRKKKIFAVIMVVILCIATVAFGMYFIFITKDDNISSWSQHMNRAGKLFYVAFIESIWLMMFVIIYNTIKYTLKVYKKLYTSGIKNEDIKACKQISDILKMDLSVILLYIIGLIINIKGDLYLDFKYNVTHGLYILMYKHSYIFFIIFFLLTVYCSMIIATLIEIRKQMNDMPIQNDSDISNTPFLNVVNVTVFIATAIVPFIALIIQCMQ